MDITGISREEKKEMLDVIFDQDKLLVHEWYREKVKEGELRKEEIAKMVEKHFEEYDSVFKRLA